MNQPELAPMDDALHDRSTVFAALGEPVRLAIVESLLLSDLTPQDIVTAMDIRSNLLAHHLNVLQAAGLLERIRSTGDGRRRYLRLRSDTPRPIVHVPPLHARNVLFVCADHGVRSMIAERLWATISDIPASSAGRAANRTLSPMARRVATETNLGALDRPPTAWQDLRTPPDLLVTLSDVVRETADLPTGPNTTLLHWSTPEPADEQRRTHTDMIQQMAARMHVLVTALGSTNGARERVSA